VLNRYKHVCVGDTHGCFVRWCAELCVCGCDDKICDIVVDRAVVTTLAGSWFSNLADGSGSNAGFLYPSGVAVDASGTVFVADKSNHRIRKATTFAGTVMPW
jgi:hypothetical protein